MPRQSLLVRETPLDALCHHFNVHPTPHPNEPTGATFDMLVIRDERMPTHVLAVTSSDQSSMPPLMLPIDATLFAQGFPLELNLSPTSRSTAPHPRYVGSMQMVNLPVIEMSVPHAPTLPLLLLYGMRLETDTNILSFNLLPVNVVEEFPNAAHMSLVLSRHREDRFDRVYNHNLGIWKNMLAMGFSDAKILQLVQTAWNVTAEARRIRQRLRF